MELVKKVLVGLRQPGCLHSLTQLIVLKANLSFAQLSRHHRRPSETMLANLSLELIVVIRFGDHVGIIVGVRIVAVAARRAREAAVPFFDWRWAHRRRPGHHQLAVTQPPQMSQRLLFWAAECFGAAAYTPPRGPHTAASLFPHGSLIIKQACNEIEPIWK